MSDRFRSPTDGERCRARTRAGRRCRRWATAASREAGRPRCDRHSSDRPGRAAGDPRLCGAVNRKGRPCGHWAMHGTEPPRCFAHRSPRFRQPGPADDAAGRACTATTLAGQRCRHLALQGTDPPRCFIHAYPAAHGRLSHGYFRRTPFRAEAMAGVTIGYEPGGANDPLALEIAVARFKVAGLLAYLEQPELPPAAFLRAARLLMHGLRATARLLRSQQMLAERALFPDADIPIPQQEASRHVP